MSKHMSNGIILCMRIRGNTSARTRPPWDVEMWGAVLAFRRDGGTKSNASDVASSLSPLTPKVECTATRMDVQQECYIDEVEATTSSGSTWWNVHACSDDFNLGSSSTKPSTPPGQKP